MGVYIVRGAIYGENMMKGGAQTKKGAVGDLPPFDLLTQTIARGFAMLTAAVPSHRARAEHDD